ncbi:MAG: glycosyltransferase [Magnetospirillum sp.]|nr:glycosyltransferase [Magnetospirillum sp.]
MPALPPLGLAQARDAVLGAMPPAFAKDRALAECIGPAASHLHAAYMATRREPEAVSFGTLPARPAASIVVPLYRVLDFLRFQVAAFAVDPAMAEVELIYVLDSPEQREEAEHLLLGLHALYGLPMTLLVQSGNYGFSSACNTGGRAARAPAVLFLNSDVIPDRPGWLAPMLAELAGPRVGAVGPKLLFDDQSLQHAGMFFQRDLKGAWLNQHYFKGMPRDFAPACHARSVPAVTGAAVLMPASLFHQVGGFCQDYIIGDYEDSDLCLKVRAAGYDIRYQPAAELFHLERRSISRHAGYMRGIACAYNRRLHADRWDGLMESLCPAGPAGAATNDDFAPLAGAAE